jgi:hypothetical protein
MVVTVQFPASLQSVISQRETAGAPHLPQRLRRRPSATSVAVAEAVCHLAHQDHAGWIGVVVGHQHTAERSSAPPSAGGLGAEAALAHAAWRRRSAAPRDLYAVAAACVGDRSISAAPRARAPCASCPIGRLPLSRSCRPVRGVRVMAPDRSTARVPGAPTVTGGVPGPAASLLVKGLEELLLLRLEADAAECRYRSTVTAHYESGVACAARAGVWPRLLPRSATGEVN